MSIKLHGYIEAQKIDKLISKLLAKHPVSKSNRIEWFKLTRTIESSLILINAKIERFADSS